MPSVNICLTRNFRDQWSDFWKTRPASSPPVLLEALSGATVATDFTGFSEGPRNDAEFWLVPEMPEHFIVAAKSGTEWKVVGIRRRKVSRQQVVERLDGSRCRPPVDVVERLLAEVEELKRKVAELEARVQPDVLLEGLRAHTRETRRSLAG